ncbi:hypothetical protein GJ744_010721 [Endocarpon pusillum]|uniref:Uncharacterized protein n=1 Tax=Endocarpon pusillum TaxID=364733 RepID=A0A8H7AG62_9EURO|nr:hypothetical protein GJ744_010721 [Endocarpon pusillum]
MLSRAGQKALPKVVPGQNLRAIRNYHAFRYHASLRPSGCMRQLVKVQHGWCCSFTTTRTPTDKLRNVIHKARQDHPFLFPTLLVASFASVCWLTLLTYDAYTREKPTLGNFPPEVERHLHNAIWYTEIKPEPTIAADSFTRAIEQAEREGMDPFSPEFTGIHIRFAAALEKFGQAKGAVQILDRLANDLEEKIEEIDRGRATQFKASTTQSNKGEAPGSSARSSAGATAGAQETERARLLKRAIECKVKISNLYGSDYIQDNVTAKRVIDEAMKMLIEAMRDPRSLRFDENRAGITADEAGAMLSGAGGNNMIWGNFGTALEIFKLALVAVRQATKGKPSCREALVLSDMSAAAAMLLDEPNPIIDGKPATEASIKRTRHILRGWAQEALQCAQAVESSERDKLCSMAVLTAWPHMAGTLRALGDLKGSRAMWEQVLDTGKQPDLQPLVPFAQNALRELDAVERDGVVNHAPTPDRTG